MNFELLLSKYMRHVMCEEGCAFIPNSYDVGFNDMTVEDVEYLQELGKRLGYD